MEKYILESFFQQGDAVSALERMKRRYQEMVSSNLTTLWEDWRIGGSGGGSINHGWAAGPLTLLSQYVAGIRPVDPGWKSFIIKPALGDLKWVNCTAPAGSKTISVRINRTFTGAQMNVINNLGCAYVLAIPKNSKTKKIRINNKILDIKTFGKLSTPDLTFLRMDDEYFYIKTNIKDIKIATL